VSYRIDRCKFKYEIDFNRPGTESAGTLVPFKVSL
jgi:hypothetical protein